MMSIPSISFSFEGKELFNKSSADVEDDLHNSSTIVLRYTETLNLPGESDGGTYLKIFNDGYVVIYYPDYMKQSGHYSVYLDTATLDRLWVMLTSKHLLEFDEKAIRKQMQQENLTQNQALSTLSRVADAAITHLEVYLTNHKAVDTLIETKKIAWYGLKWDAKKYPEILEIQKLALVQLELQAILDRSDIKPIGSTKTSTD